MIGHTKREVATSSTPALAIWILLPLIILSFVLGGLGCGTLVEAQERQGAKWDVPSTSDAMDDLQRGRNEERLRAAWWLAEHESSRGTGPLIAALDDSDADVRLVSAWALGEIKDKAAIDPLIETLKTDRDPFVREMAVLSLGEIESRRALDVLREARERSDDLAKPVAWAEGEILQEGTKQVWAGEAVKITDIVREHGRIISLKVRGLDYSEEVDRLLVQLHSSSPKKRREAALNLGLLGMADRYESLNDIESVVDGLIAALRDSEPEVRARAVWALDEINPSRSCHARSSKHDCDHDHHHDHGHGH